jgi:hypothetical protein
MDSAPGTVPWPTGNWLTCFPTTHMIKNTFPIPKQPPIGCIVIPPTIPHGMVWLSSWYHEPVSSQKGRGAHSENKHHFITKNKCIVHVFEPNRTCHLSGVIEKTYFLTKDVSKQQAAHFTLPLEVQTRYSPWFLLPTHSKMHCDPFHSLKMAAPSLPSWSIKRLHSHQPSRPKLPYSNIVFWEHSSPVERWPARWSKGSKLHPDGGTVAQEHSQPSNGHVPIIPKEQKHAKMAWLSKNVQMQMLTLKRS